MIKDGYSINKGERMRTYGKPLLTAMEIQRKVEELGQKIASDYNKEELLIVGILKGAFIFMSDLVRAIKKSVSIDFIMASSYGDRTETSGTINIILDLREDISDKNVILVDDIIDSGLTLNCIKNLLLERKPKTLKTCVLLDKIERRKVDVKIDYLGFTIPNKYVVGYGLDYQGLYRNLPYVAVLLDEEWG